MDCKTCKEIRTQGNQYYSDITAAMAERTQRRMMVIIVLLLIGFFTMTYLYIKEKTSYETTESTIEMEAPDGTLSHVYVAGVGDVYYNGENTSENENQTP